MSLWRLLGELLTSYVTFAWPFSLAHLAIVVFVLRSWWSMHEEARALLHWGPERRLAGSPSRGTQVTGILDRFVAETEALGPQGFLVSMTDFSDRLDSIVDGMVAEVNEKINLFLIVGIGGSLFGVFEFAFRAADVLQPQSGAGGERVVRLGEILAQSLAKAFPVGFMGLLLMFLFQIAASVRERELKAALAHATNKALARRSEVSRAQAQLVSQAAQAIQQALAPIASLEAVLTKSLEPVVRELGMRLDESLGLIKAQFVELRTTTAQFSDSVALLTDNVESLQQSAGNLETLLQRAPDVLVKVGQMHEKQASILDAFEASLTRDLEVLDRLLSSLDSVAAGVRELPGTVDAATREALARAGRDVAMSWTQTASRVEQEVTTGYRGLFTELTSQTATLHEHVRAAQGALSSGISEQATTLRALAAQVSGELKSVETAAQDAIQSFRQLSTETRATMERSFLELSETSRKRWERMTDSFGRELERAWLDHLAKLTESGKELRTSLKDLARVMEQALQTNQAQLETQLHGTMQKVHQDVSAALRAFDSLLAKRVPEAAAQITEFTTYLDMLSRQVVGSRTAMEEWNKTLDAAQQALAQATKDEPAHRKRSVELLEQIRDRLNVRPSRGPRRDGTRIDDAGERDGGFWGIVKSLLARLRRRP